MLPLIKNVFTLMTKIKEFWNKVFGARLSPAFLVMLGLSLLMWYLSKLDYTYTAEVPVSLRFEGEKYRVMCMAEGTGRQIVGHRWFARRAISLDTSKVVLLPVEGKDGYYSIEAGSLQNFISVNHSDLRIISIGTPPELRLDGKR